MLLKRLLFTFFTALFFQLTYADQSINLSSPGGNIQLGVTHRDNGELVYQVFYKGKTVIAPSGLGFKFKSPDVSLLKFDLVAADSSAKDETWKPVCCEQSIIRNHY